MYELEDGVPIPPIKRRSKNTPRRKYPFESMKIGTVMYVPDKTIETASTHAHKVASYLGYKFTIRTIDILRDSGTGRWRLAADDELGDAMLGVGIWRIQ